MRKFTGLVSFLLAALTLLLDASSLFAQTVYFQRNLNTGSQEGRLSFGPSDGSVTANDLISGMSSTVDAGITTDGLGNFFISSPVTSEILKIDYLANTSVVANSTATLYRPTFLTLDSSNKRLYYWDQSIYTINRIEVRTVLPVTSSDVSIFADNTSYTSSITDIKFNIVDRHLYWTHNNRLFRAPETFDRTNDTPEELLPSVAGGIRFFDFDQGTPQTIYFVDRSMITEGLYRSTVPTSPSVNLNETRILDTSPDNSNDLYGIALDQVSNTMCYGAYQVEKAAVRCANRDDPGIFTTVIIDDGTTNIIEYPPSQLVMVSAPTVTPSPTPTPTEIPTIVPTPGPVSFKSPPTPPEVEVNVELRQVTITLQEFEGFDISARIRAAFRSFIRAAQRAAGSNVTLRYRVKLRQTTDASGNPLDARRQTVTSKTVKRNELTVGNLVAGSSYNVKYRVQVMSRGTNGTSSITRRSPFSTGVNFSVR